MANYDAVISRWLDIILHDSTKPNLRNERMPTRDDRIFSYGDHFEIAQLIRDRKGKPSHFLLNGDRWPGVVTTRQQSLVRGEIARTKLPSVTIPYSALDQAGIRRDTVTILEVTPDWTERKEIVCTELPPGAVWDYATTTVPGTGGYYNAGTGEYLPDYHEYEQRIRDAVGPYTSTSGTWDEHYTRLQAARREWEDVPHRSQSTGRKRLRTRANSHHEWELFDVDGQVAYRRETTRHWLGEALIEADVAYRHVDRKSGAWSTKRRKARFLSGFDRGETRPSYFFCELPPKSTATTVEAALDALKPSAVRLAEDLGRDVARQGDIFGVPISFTKRDLTKAGARYERAGQLFNTNHVATEVATLPDGRTFARGNLRHAPQRRRPDHKRVSLGQGWSLIVRNTVPIAV